MNAESAPSEADELKAFFGEEVVLDVRGELLYVGVLEEVTSWFYVLKDADVHDVVATRTGKEVYLIEAAKHGVKKNRHLVHVKAREVLSLSLLADVVKY